MFETLHSYLPWILLWSALALGVVGVFVPLLPAHLLILAGAGGHYFLLRESSGVGLGTFIVLIILAVGSQLFETLSGSLGAKYSGGGKWGIIGATAGLIVGLFFPPFGFLIGTLLGAFLGEKFLAQKTLREATTAGIGSAVGTLTGLVMRGVVALAMISYLLLDIFLWD